MGEKELMEDKDKEIEKLCKKAESLIIRYKRGEIPMKSYYPYQNTSYGYKTPDEKLKEFVRADADKAEKLIRRALTLSEKKSAEALRLQGYVNYLQKNDYSVMPNYEKAYKIEPDNWKLLYNMALCYYYIKTDLEKACEYIIKAIEINSNRKDLWHFLSDLFFIKLGKMPDFLATVMKYHLKFLESFPNDDLALRKMGEIYYKQNNFVEVIKHYKPFTERNPKDFYELKLLGDAYREIGDIDNAIITYEKYVKNDPKSKEINKFLFEYYSSQGYNLTNEEEVVDFIKNRELKEKKARTLCITGFTRNQRGNAQGAVEILEEALKLDPKSTDARVYLGVSNVILGNTEKGFQLINEIIKQHPDNSNAHISLGQVFKIIGDINKSIESYEKGIALMTVQNDKYYNNKVELALLYSGNNNIQKATELFDDTVKNNPDKPKFLNLCGTFYISQKNPQKALELFIKVLKLDQHLSKTYIDISLIHADLGNFDAALAYLKVALKIHPDDTQIEGALKKVYEKWGKPLDLEKFKKNL